MISSKRFSESWEMVAQAHTFQGVFVCECVYVCESCMWETIWFLLTYICMTYVYMCTYSHIQYNLVITSFWIICLTHWDLGMPICVGLYMPFLIYCCFPVKVCLSHRAPRRPPQITSERKNKVLFIKYGPLPHILTQQMEREGPPSFIVKGI